ncbi:MAG TPA: shikimate dehydrogenase [Solirubrobacteraceae bacterium]|nr:shikimate dehydrogenase [Solirubrobacteraceae bacterium]
MPERTRLGVFGWPVGHSRSPAMQNAALRAVGLTGWRYQRLPVPPELFAETARALGEAGFRGANVTIPHKHAALAIADEATPRARAIGAANTLVFDAEQRIWADNTDAPALIAALPLAISGRVALVLGAGGSARAAVWALLDAGAEVRVWNRTPERAQRLCEEIGGRPVRTAEPADVLVHCTSSGLDGPDGAFKQLPISADLIDRYECVVDFVYSDSGSPITTAARAQSIPVVDGLELLVGQGALSFERFTGREAPVDIMRAATRARASE